MRTSLSNAFGNTPLPNVDRQIGLKNISERVLMCCTVFDTPSPSVIGSQTWTLKLLATLMAEIVISPLTFNNIWEQEAHLLSLFVLVD